MKTRSIVAMVIDNDPGYAKSFSNTIKELFNKVYVQHDDLLAIKELAEVKPQVVFLNLTLSQRKNHFEILDKLNIHGEEPVVIFGYNDSQEDELLAHAIETGINDIFIRPFDPDIISSKINRFFQSEKTQNRDLQYTKITPPIKATLKLPMKVVSIDENGITMKGDHYISKGTTLPLKNALIKEVFGIDTMEFMITRTWITDDWKEYYLFAEPKVSNEQYNAALRRFILRKI